jgi:hypothetical protein
MSGLELLEHMVMRRVMLMRSTQSMGLLSKNRSLIEFFDLELIVEVLFLEFFYNFLEVLSVSFYLTDLYLEVLYGFLKLSLIR